MISSFLNIDMLQTYFALANALITVVFHPFNSLLVVNWKGIDEDRIISW